MRNTLTTLALLAITASSASAQLGSFKEISGQGWQSFMPLDADGDGDLDIIATTNGASSFANLTLHVNLNGAFATQQVLTALPAAWTAHVTPMNFDGDEFPDFAVSLFALNSDTTYVRVYELVGPFSFELRHSFPTGLTTVPSGILAEDLDGDGLDDLLLQANPLLRTFPNDGQGGFGSLTGSYVAGNAYAIGDINGDGSLDIVYANGNNDRVAWLEGDGTGTFGPDRLISAAGDNPNGVDLGDFDDDGDLDVVVSTRGSVRQVFVVRNLGFGAFGQQEILASSPSSFRGVDVADMDLDGDLDVVATSSNEVVLLENQFMGFFGAPTAVTKPPALTAPQVFDADGDGDQDVVVGATSSFSNTVNGWVEWTGTIGTTYCTSPVNSTGLAGELTITGSTLRDINSVGIRATQMPPFQFGIFATSRTQALLPNLAGGEGTLCLGGSVGRYQGPNEIMPTGVDGTFRLLIDLNDLRNSTGSVSGVAGQTWNFQAWHRDVVNGQTTSNLTSAASITLQ